MKFCDKIKIAVMVGVIALSGVMVGGVSAAEACPTSTIRGKNGGTYENSIAECNVPEDETDRDLMSILTNIINVVVGIVGFLAVVMIIVGGISYTLSAGDANKVKKAKDTIMYGIIGLIVAILAYAIVNFVLANLFTTA